MNRHAMTTYERHQTILQLIEEHGNVKVTELAVLFNVSEGTVRNDLNALEDLRLLTRVHGGAISADSDLAPSIFNSRAKINAEAKKKISRWASELVADGDVILLDASSTAYHMATFLQDRHNITVVTNQIDTARRLIVDPTKRVILLGGLLRPDGLSVSGAIGQEVLKNLHINKAFISCVGFSIEAGFMEADLDEAHLKQQVLQSAGQVVVLVDSSKFGKLGLRPFASIRDVTHLVTDDSIDEATITTLRESNVALTICGETSVQSRLPRDTEQRYYTIGFANLSEQIAFSVDVRRSLERAAKNASNIDLIYVDNNLHGDTAIRLADELIDQGVDLMIEYQIDEAAGNVIMSKFKQHNIPVIAIDIPMIGATYFGVDNFVAGEMAGQALGQWIVTRWHGEVDHVIVLEEPRAGTLPAARIQGQLYGLTEIVGPLKPDVFTYIDSGNTSEISYANTRNVIHPLPRTTRIALVCFNDDAALGALRAVTELEHDRAVIVGQGADRLVRAEIRHPHSPIIGSTAFMPERYGEPIIELALKILNGKPVPPAIYMDHMFIDSINIDQYYPQ
jgi:ribose transport system substrate-binding protein